MLDPTGVMAVINSCVAFFRAVQSAVEYLREILAIINEYTSTLAAIASGNVATGAKKLETALAHAVPVAIGFLRHAGRPGNVPEKVVELINGLRQTFRDVLVWVIGGHSDSVGPPSTRCGLLGKEDAGRRRGGSGGGRLQQDLDRRVVGRGGPRHQVLALDDFSPSTSSQRRRSCPADRVSKWRGLPIFLAQLAASSRPRSVWNRSTDLQLTPKRHPSRARVGGWDRQAQRGVPSETPMPSHDTLPGGPTCVPAEGCQRPSVRPDQSLRRVDADEPGTDGTSTLNGSDILRPSKAGLRSALRHGTDSSALGADFFLFPRRGSQTYAASDPLRQPLSTTFRPELCVSLFGRRWCLWTEWRNGDVDAQAPVPRRDVHQPKIQSPPLST